MGRERNCAMNHADYGMIHSDRVAICVTVSVFHRRQETRSIKRRAALSGNEKRKRAPGPDRALYCDFTAVRFDNVFAKDQANSGGRVGVGVMIEAFTIAKEHLLIFRRDADPLINHGKARSGSAVLPDFVQADGDAAAARSKLDGVGY